MWRREQLLKEGWSQDSPCRKGLLMRSLKHEQTDISNEKNVLSAPKQVVKRFLGRPGLNGRIGDNHYL